MGADYNDRFAMTSCSHSTLELLPERKERMRCRHCHLTINADEVGDGYCPECFEHQGKKRYDFETVTAPKSESVRYRCAECGIVIDSQ
jgi:predicted RNA-binding Zn-ribbon protein involved in translation (DUF1610 family)